MQYFCVILRHLTPEYANEIFIWCRLYYVCTQKDMTSTAETGIWQAVKKKIICIEVPLKQFLASNRVGFHYYFRFFNQTITICGNL